MDTSVVYLALGSNMGDRAAYLRAAIERLQPGVRIATLSPVYETAPMYVTDQPAFLNMVIKGETALPPPDLLALAKRVEADLGRKDGGPRFGPRPIDVDILFYGNLCLHTPDLEIPHPRLTERAFVLRPLVDMGAGKKVHPGLGLTMDELLRQLPESGAVALYNPRLPACAAETYTIIIKDFTAPVSLGGTPGSARISLTLDVLHPGPDFPDDINAVMSYEDIVVGLRRLCTDRTLPAEAAEAGRLLADRTLDLCCDHPRVRRVQVQARLTPEGAEKNGGSDIVFMRQRST